MLESKEGKKDPKRDVRNAAAPPPTSTAAAAAGSTLDESRIEDNPEEGLVGVMRLVDGRVTAALLTISIK